MPRRPLLRTGKFPYHVTSRSNNKDWFYIPIERCWWIFCEKLSDSCAKYQAFVSAFVLMSNHFHLMVSTPLSNLGEFMGHFLTNVSKAIQADARRMNHVFGGRYRWSLLDSSFSVAYVMKYIYRNPVRAGVVQKVEDHRYSSLLSGTPMGQVDGIGPLWTQIPKAMENRLEWLNKPAPKELELLIRQGLRQETFRFSKDNSKQKLIRMLEATYGVGEIRDDRLLPSLEGD